MDQKASEIKIYYYNIMSVMSFHSFRCKLKFVSIVPIVVGVVVRC